MTIPEKAKKFIVPVAAVVVLALAAIPTYYFYSKYQESQKLLKNPNEAVTNEVNNLVREVGKIVELPSGETPTLATVADVERLKNQPFFTHAQNGDKVLIYTNARKAFLYRPATKRIIEIAPVNLGDASQATAAASVAGATDTATDEKIGPFSVAIRNGTTVSGFTKKYEAELKAAFPDARITSRENAKRTNYTRTFIVDNKKDKAQMVNAIAIKLGIVVGNLPSDEALIDDADFLIVLGSDKAGATPSPSEEASSSASQ